VAIVVQQITTEPSYSVSEKDKIMIITKMVLNETPWLLDFNGRSKSYHLLQIVFGGSAELSQQLKDLLIRGKVKNYPHFCFSNLFTQK
jgi:hypothetical protein